MSLDYLYMGLNVNSQVLSPVFSPCRQRSLICSSLFLSAFLLMQHVTLGRAAVICRGSVTCQVIILDKGMGKKQVKNRAGH